MNRMVRPGIPATGHISVTGFLHPGSDEGCVKCADDQWEQESAETYRRAPYVPAEQAVGLCGICHAPVLKGHDPTPIEWVGTGEAGVIHGAFDCTDQPRCEEILPISGGGGLEGKARCVLPANHIDASVDHLPGEPG